MRRHGTTCLLRRSFAKQASFFGVGVVVGPAMPVLELSQFSHQPCQKVLAGSPRDFGSRGKRTSLDATRRFLRSNALPREVQPLLQHSFFDSAATHQKVNKFAGGSNWPPWKSNTLIATSNQLSSRRFSPLSPVRSKFQDSGKPSNNRQAVTSQGLALLCNPSLQKHSANAQTANRQAARQGSLFSLV